MRHIVFGAGAVGGVVGARLAQAGHDVVLIARGRHAEAMRSGGIVVEAGGDSTAVDVPVVTSPAEIRFEPGDVVLLAVKSQDTIAALQALRPAALPATPVMCVQNGVANERMAIRVFANVYGICVMLPAAHLEPGVVQAFSTPVSGLLDIGRYPSGVDGTAEGVAATLGASTFDSLVRPDIMRWKYAKLLRNVGNAIDALCGPEGRSSPLMTRAQEEGRACLRAAGIDFASEEEDDARRGDLLRMRPAAGKRWSGSSTWQSVARGSGAVETDYLNGEIALLGRLHEVPTPVNAMLQREAARLAASGAEAGSVRVEDLLAKLA